MNKAMGFWTVAFLVLDGGLVLDGVQLFAATLIAAACGFFVLLICNEISLLGKRMR